MSKLSAETVKSRTLPKERKLLCRNNSDDTLASFMALVANCPVCHDGSSLPNHGRREKEGRGQLPFLCSCPLPPMQLPPKNF